MKQLLHRFDTGISSLADVPVPTVSGVNLLVETRSTVVSAGTERMLVEFGRASLLAKARSQPDKVKQVLDKMKTDGIGTTVQAVRAKLDAPVPLGYCQAGIVVETGSQVSELSVGDRVVTNGPHSEYVRVPMTLSAKIPDSVSFETAAFTPLAAIGLQGIRLAAPTIGETVVVMGLGLIGLLTVQMLQANGCRVIGIDPDPGRLALAAQFGATCVPSGQDSAAQVSALTAGVGADAVLLTLASSSDDPIHLAAAMSRKRGRIVLVGVTGLNLVRDDFYKKELTFSVSCSYGPGRYDPSYEEGGRDYPLPYVRWTEQRNFEAVLALMASRRLDPQPLVTHRFDFDSAPAAYDLIAGPEPHLGVVLTYPDREGRAPVQSQRVLEVRAATSGKAAGVVGVIGAGNFAVRTLLPVVRDAGLRLRTVASGSGTGAAVAAEKFGFERSSTDVEAVFADSEIDTVFVLTRHDSHFRFTIRALEAGKHVFVEKPLALTEAEVDEIKETSTRTGRMVLVGFNRRFAPLTDEVQRLLKGRAGPLSVVATVNAGEIPREHWTQDPEVGGGRIIGEACHWIDLARALVGAPIADMKVETARDSRGRPVEDIAHLAIGFADGSTACIHYLSTGAREFPKERIECFWDGKTVAIDNWRRLRRYGLPRPWFERGGPMDKGHAEEIIRWAAAVRDGGPSPIPLDELLEVSRWSIRAANMARASSI